MNGDYLIASGANQGVAFNNDYASKGMEYFDVWAPEIATQYAQVFWTSQGTLPLPDDIIKRFDGKVIALTGYEQDQVRMSESCCEWGRVSAALRHTCARCGLCCTPPCSSTTAPCRAEFVAVTCVCLTFRSCKTHIIICSVLLRLAGHGDPDGQARSQPRPGR